METMTSPTNGPEIPPPARGEKWVQVAKPEAWGGRAGCHTGVRVDILAPVVDLTDDERWAIARKAEEIHELVQKAAFHRDPRRAQEAEQNRMDILGLFLAPVHVREIPNRYCAKWCCEHLPWFSVTTAKGPIIVGWRKRVIEIDWSHSDRITGAEQLFPDEDVTKGPRFIHAWGVDKAREYIDKILGAP
jgi:transposase